MKELNALYFGTHDREPVFRTVPTLLPCDPDKGVDLDGFPSVEAVLGSAHTIHDCWVTWKDASQRRHRFLISFQYRPDLDINNSLLSICSSIQLRAELVVLRGTFSNRPATIRYGEPNRLARQAVRKYVLSRVARYECTY